MATFEELKKIDLRVGKIIEVFPLNNTGYVTHKVIADFGNIGKKISLVNLKKYRVEELQNKLVIGIVNLPPKEIAGDVSEVLLLGTPDQGNECILISPDSEHATIGAKVF